MESIQVPYIGDDGRLYLSPQPKISPAHRPQQPFNAPDVIAIPFPPPKYTMTEMIELFEARQTLHEKEFRQSSPQPPVPRYNSSSKDPEDTVLFITKRFAALAGALLGHHEELAMGDLPSQKFEFPTFIQEYITAKGVLSCLVHDQQAQGQGQISDSLALGAFNHWLVEDLKAFVYTTFGQRFAGFLPEQHLIDSAQLLEAGPVVEYMEQILNACRIQITDKGATLKEVGGLLKLKALLKGELPPSMSPSITHYIDGLVNSVCSHIVRRACHSSSLQITCPPKQ